MNKVVQFIAFFISLQLGVKAQTFSYGFGKIGQSEIEYNSCPFDKSAEAVVLFDYGSSHFEQFDNSFILVYERTTRVKILKEAGIKWAEVEIPFYQEGDIYEQVENVEASTYNFEDGMLKRSDFDKKNMHEEKINNMWNQKKFALPNVKEGSVIEYRYKVRSEYFFNFRDWEFQWKIPVLMSKYEVKMIPFYEYTFLLQGASKFDSQTSVVDNGIENQFGPIKYQDMIHTYVMKNVPAFKGEEFITSINDYIIKLDFQLSTVIDINGAKRQILTTWPELVKDLSKDEEMGGYAKKAEKFSPKIFDLNSLSNKTPRQKFDSIMNYMKENFTWNKMYGKYSKKSPKDIFKDKIGNVAELNLFAIGMLNAAGITATPVILSTRDNGKIKSDYPFVGNFNYVVILADVDGKKILSDATEEYLSNDLIPERCVNERGLLIQKDKVEWVSLQAGTPSKTRTLINMKVSESSISSQISKLASEYEAIDYRKDFGSKISEVSKHLTDKGYSVNDSSIFIKNSPNKKDPYALNYETKDKPEIINGKMYISPFLHECVTENPLKQQVRTYPIDLIYPMKHTFYSEINIPEGYKVDFTPENLKINNDQFELDYNIVNSNNKVIVSFVYFFKKPVYQADDYSKIKYYFNEIANKGNEKLVFVKKIINIKRD